MSLIICNLFDLGLSLCPLQAAWQSVQSIWKLCNRFCYHWRQVLPTCVYVCVCLPGTRLVSVVGQTTAWLCYTLIFVCFSGYRFKLWAANKVWACNQKQIHLTNVSVENRMIKTQAKLSQCPERKMTADSRLRRTLPSAATSPKIAVARTWARTTHPYKQIWHITSLTCCPLCGLLS